MLNYLGYFIILSLVPWSFQSSSTPAVAGVIDLDEISFDKIIDKFKVALVKFDVAYPYGDQHEAFTALGREAKDHEDIVIAHVGVKDYGEKENEDLAKKYKATKENFPQVRLFMKGLPEPLNYEGDFTTDDFRRFIRERGAIHLSLPGCVRELDKIVEEFLTGSSDKRPMILNEFKSISNGLKEKDLEAAKIYKKVMEKIIEKGDDFLDTELERVKRVLTTKLSKEKLKDLNIRLNIIQTFHDISTRKIKDLDKNEL